jgi:hypothetical protein
VHTTHAKRERRVGMKSNKMRRGGMRRKEEQTRGREKERIKEDEMLRKV